MSMTLNRIAEQGANGVAMMPIIQGVARAAATISALLRSAVFKDVLGEAGAENVQGEQQQNQQAHHQAGPIPPSGTAVCRRPSHPHKVGQRQQEKKGDGCCKAHDLDEVAGIQYSVFSIQYSVFSNRLSVFSNRLSVWPISDIAH